MFRISQANNGFVADRGRPVPVGCTEVQSPAPLPYKPVPLGARKAALVMFRIGEIIVPS